MSLYEGAVKKPIMTTLCFVAVMILGLFSLSKLPVDLYPDIDTNTIMVITTYPGASASDIENNVTRPLENTLNSVEHLKHITSQSRENTSVITLEFEYGNDIEVITNDVRDKLDMVSSMLPDESNTPIIFKFSTDMIPIVILSVQANESQNALYKILDDNVANPLARIDGVGTVSISGAPEREINVYMDARKMEAYGIPVETVTQIIAQENKNVPGGSFDVGNNTYALRVEGEFKDPQQMLNIIVGTHNGAPVYLRDIARIVDGVQERAQKAYNGGKQMHILEVFSLHSGVKRRALRSSRGVNPELRQTENLAPQIEVDIAVSLNIRGDFVSRGREGSIEGDRSCHPGGHFAGFQRRYLHLNRFRPETVHGNLGIGEDQFLHNNRRDPAVRVLNQR